MLVKKLFFVASGFLLKIISGLWVLQFSSRELSVGEFGKISQYLTMLAVIFTLCILGSGNFLIKKFSGARNEEANCFSNAMSLNLLSSVFFIILLFSLRSVVEEHVIYRNMTFFFYIYLAFLYFISGVSLILLSFMVARGDLKVVFFANLFSFLLYVPSVLLSVEAYGVDGLFYSLPLINIFPVVVYFIAGKKNIENFWVFRLDRDFVKDSIRFSSVVWVGVASVPLTGLFVRNYFAQNYGFEELALWQAGVKFSETLQQLFGIVLSYILFPLFSKNENNIDEINILKYLAIFFAAYVSALFLLSDLVTWIVVEFFGESYRGSSDYLLIYLLGDCLRVMGLVLVYFYMARGKMRQVFSFEIMQGVFYVALCYLSMKASSKAVAYSYVGTYVGCFLMMIVFLKMSRKAC